MRTLRAWERTCAGGAGLLLAPLLDFSGPSETAPRGAPPPSSVVTTSEPATTVELLAQLRAQFGHTAVLRSGSSTALAHAVRRGNVAPELGAALPAGGEDPARPVLALDESIPTAFALSESVAHVSVAGLIDGLTSVTARSVDGYLIWRDAAGDRAHVLRRFHDDGFEDVVAFERAPVFTQLSYSVQLAANVAGLRLVDDSLEFLDAGGVPRLGVARPVVLSSDGTRREAHLDVERCNVDIDPAPPWERPVIPPGASECTLRVTWDGEAVTYPALVDSFGVATSNKIEVSVAHGTSSSSNGTADAQTSVARNDPATTWATGNLMLGRRQRREVPTVLVEAPH